MREIPTASQTRTIRLLLLMEIVVYATWFFVVEASDPGAYNPGWSRAIVVALPTIFLLGSFRDRRICERLEELFYLSLWVLMAHHFHSKHVNYHNVAWPLASYITVAAVCACFQSSRALVSFSAYTFALGTGIAWINGNLYNFYVPGLFTILLTMNASLYYRNRALRELSEAKARFERLFNAVFEGIVLHEEGRIIAVNESFGRLLGYAPRELVGREVLSLVAPRSLEEVVARMAGVSESPYEVWALDRSGRELPAEICVKSHVYDGREVRMIAVRDRSERHALESERLRTLEAEAAVQLRDEFISIASHELRTPLTPLKLSHQMLRRSVEEASMSREQTVKLLRNAETQVTRIIRLVDDMLDVSRMSSGRFELRLESFDLAEALRDIGLARAEELRRAGCALEIRCRGDLHVEWDRIRIEQAIENLMKNAALYGAGRPIRLSSRGSREVVVVSVRDWGIGIAPEDQARIFDRFERAVSAKHYGGLGLGLYVVRQIARAHQGEIRLWSRSGRGSRFSLILPRRARPAFLSLTSDNAPSRRWGGKAPTSG